MFEVSLDRKFVKYFDEHLPSNEELRARIRNTQ